MKQVLLSVIGTAIATANILEFNLERRQRLTQTTTNPMDQVSLTNLGNYEYLVTLYVGSALQPLKCMIDTGSSALVLQSFDCNNCVTTLYNQGASTTFVQSTNSDSIIYSDGSEADGFISSDTVGINPATVYNATSFNFLLAQQMNGFPIEDGLIGLAKPNDTTSNYINFVAALVNQGVIQSGVFALLLTNQNSYNQLHVGGYSTSPFRTGLSTITQVPMDSDPTLWRAAVSGFRVGTADFYSDSTPAGYKFSATRIGLLDSGIPNILAPSDVYQSLITALLHGQTTTVTNGQYYSTCDTTKYQSLYIALNGNWFEVPATTFVQPVQQGASTCQILIGSSGDDTFVLGVTFLINYYSVWDYVNNQVGFIPHTYSTASISNVVSLPATTFTLPMTPLDNIFYLIQVIGAGSIGVGTLGLLGGVGAYCLYLLLQAYGLLTMPLADVSFM